MSAGFAEKDAKISALQEQVDSLKLQLKVKEDLMESKVKAATLDAKLQMQPLLTKAYREGYDDAKNAIKEAHAMLKGI